MVEACSSISAGPAMRLPASKPRAVEDRRVDEAGVARNRPGACRGSACAGGSRRRRPIVLERRLLHDAGDGRAQADDLGRLVRRGGAVALLVHRIESALDAVAILRREKLERQFDGHRVLLADIAHVGARAELTIARGAHGAMSRSPARPSLLPSSR